MPLSLSRSLETEGRFRRSFRFCGISKKTVEESPAGSVFLLENLRFVTGRRKERSEVCEAACVARRFLCERRFRGLASRERFRRRYHPFFAELCRAGARGGDQASFGIMTRPKRPLVMVVGGAKVSDKLGCSALFQEKSGLVPSWAVARRIRCWPPAAWMLRNRCGTETAIKLRD